MDGFPNAGDKDGRGDVDEDVTLTGAIAIDHGKENKVVPVMYFRVADHLPEHIIR